jgi:hypothetical protein
VRAHGALQQLHRQGACRASYAHDSAIAVIGGHWLPGQQSGRPFMEMTGQMLQRGREFTLAETTDKARR